MSIRLASVPGALVLAAASAASPWCAAAEPTVTAQELIDKAAPRMPAAEVKVLLAPGARVEVSAGSGQLRRWTNEADGSFVVSRQDERGRPATGQGKWQVKEDGTYCIEIKWKSSEEQWCRAVYLHDGASYLAPLDLASNADRRFSLLKVDR